MSNSNIEWTDDTPNPVVGCTKQSAGCENCYAIRMAWRLMHSDKPAVAKKYEGTVYKTEGGKLNWTGRINIDHLAMARVIKQKKPKLYFVNSMGDLFHPSVKFTDIDIVFAAMAICPQHIFQILTKHPDRMIEWLQHKDELDMNTQQRISEQAFKYWGEVNPIPTSRFPLANTWMGTSVENQKEANYRWCFLRKVAALGWFTWVSNEPSLGPIDWTGYEFIKWMVTGGESGPGVRPMHPDWARASRDFCELNKIPFFFKQWGVWLPFEETAQPPFWRRCSDRKEFDGHELNFIDSETSEAGKWGEHRWCDTMHSICMSFETGGPQVNFLKIGKHEAGRMLDGQLHDEYPQIKKGLE